MIEQLVTDNTEAVLRAWLNPPPARCSHTYEPVELPDSWTVVTSSTSANAWLGDMALISDGSHTCDLVQAIRLTAKTPVATISYHFTARR